MKYYLYNPKGSKPKIIHNDYGSALKEAKRLAEIERCDIYLLAIAATVTVETKVVEHF